MIVTIVIIAIILLIALYFIVAYNGIINVRNRVDQAWSQIDVQLTRRHDLIPNLVETVKGYAAHERETLENVINARNQAVQVQQQAGGGPAQQAQAENLLTGALRQLFALAEAYPDLKANQNFLNLQEELTSTEDRVAYARQFYNDAVQTYITRIQTFPRNLIAKMFNFQPREFYDAEEGATGVPRVQF